MRATRIMTLCGLLLAFGTQAEPEQTPREPTLTVAINTFKSTFVKDEAVPCAFVIVNRGTNTVYVAAISEPMVQLVDSSGREVPTGPLPTPPPPPPSHYMDRNGKRVLMQPVWELPPGGGRALVVSDALQHHHVNLSAGEYAFHSPIDCLPSYGAKHIVRRSGLNERLWVEAGPVVDKAQVFPSNRVTIRIKGVPNNAIDSDEK